MAWYLAQTGVVLLVLGTTGANASSTTLSVTAIEMTAFKDLPEQPTGRAEADVVRAEILLARAHLSPGSIDGHDGDSFRHAVSMFQHQAGLQVSQRLDAATWDRLNRDTAPVLVQYRITPADAKGPFTPFIPTKFERLAALRRLAYHDIREALAERFHMSPTLLLALNTGRKFQAGETIDVAAPKNPDTDAAAPHVMATSIVVDKAGHAVEAFGPDGKLLAAFPASIGSEEKPAPNGRFEIKRIVHNPDYTYFPQFHFKGVASKQRFTIAPGPNNPVGVVWIDLSFEGYGIHGTPEPELVGKTQSHGCIRLTNWDVEDLAALTDKGVAVTFQDGPDDPLAPTSSVSPPKAVPTEAMPQPSASNSAPTVPPVP